MAGEILSTTSTINYSQKKYLAAKLIQRSYLKLVAASICDKVQLEKGTGLTAYFVRFNRMNVPVAALSEGSDPSNSAFTLSQVTVTLDQWGDQIVLTDIAQLTIFHPLLQQAIELLAENAQRVIDREVQIVWLAGTSVQYGDASVSSRRTVTNAMKMSDAVIHQIRVTLVDGGAPPRGGPSGGVNVASANGSINGASAYVGICGPQVMADIMQASTSLGSFVSVAMYANQKALYNAEVGTWLNVRWVETNFIPKFTLLGNKTVIVADGGAGGITGLVVNPKSGSGSLTASTTYYWKITRKDLTRGFEEAISIAHSTATDTSEEDMEFTLPSTAGYVYNIYFDSEQGGGDGTDAKLKLVAANQAASAVVNVTAVGTGATAPDNIRASDDGLDPTAVHPVYVHGAESCNWVGLQNLETFITEDISYIGNILKRYRGIGYKFAGKAMIRDQNRMLRAEVAASYT